MAQAQQNQEPFQVTTVYKPSPCRRGFCNSDIKDGVYFCTGCGRTMREVVNWPRLTEEERITIWQRVVEEGYYPSLIKESNK